MEEVLYLKQIMLCLENEGEAAVFDKLIGEVGRYGIGVERLPVWALTPEYCAERSGGKKCRQEQGGEERIGGEKCSPEQNREEKVLYITDTEESAVLLHACHMPVLGWQKGEGHRFGGIPYVMECPEELDLHYLERIYRRFRDIPWDIARTERCLIRETTVQDVDSFYEIYNDPEMVRYTEELYPDKEQERAYIREYIEKVYHYYEFGVWTVVWKETGEVIGRAGYSVREGYDLPELGFVIGTLWQHKGVAFEICSAILRYGEEEFGFDRVQALVRPENAASLALCRRLGFAVERTVKEEGKEFYLLIREGNCGTN